MKKFLTILLAVLMVLCLAGCAKEEEEEATTDEETVENVIGDYTVINDTGAQVDELYVYPVGSTDKGTNYAEGGLKLFHYTQFGTNSGIAGDAEKFASYSGPKSGTPHYVIEYVYGDDVVGKFENLSLEFAQIVLVDVENDIEAGATQVQWYVSNHPTVTMAVDFYNMTGEEITSLKAYDHTSGELVDDILATLGKESLAKNEEKVTWTYTVDAIEANDKHLDIEWTYGDTTLTLGKVVNEVAGSDRALSVENTALVLLSEADIAANMKAPEDGTTGATPVYWLAFKFAAK